MSFTVSIRDNRKLEKMLKEGLDIELPKDCIHNSLVIYELLKYAPKVLPEFANLKEDEIKKIAGTVAYLLRPDLITADSGYVIIGPNPYFKKANKRVANEAKFSYHLRNDPKKLTPDFDPDFKDWEQDAGAEFFRCYCGALESIPGLYDKLDPNRHSLYPAFKLADLTAYLLDPKDLTDYDYSKDELSKFHKTLNDEMAEI